jgi:hypothetical protein
MYDCNYFLLLKARKLREYNPAVYGFYSIAYLVWMIGRIKENDHELRKDVESCGW